MDHEHFVVCRHGDYTDGEQDPGLNGIGQNQAARLGNELEHRLNGVDRTVLTSVSRRAKETAKIIAEILGVTPVEVEELWNDFFHAGDVQKSMEQILAAPTRGVVAVTHKEFTALITRAYARDVLQAPLSVGELKYGQAWHVRCAEKTAEKIA